NMGALKFVSLLFSLGTMALVYRIGRSHSLGAAWAAALLFAFTPSAVLAGTMALPEAPTGFALAAAYYLLFRSPMAVRWRHALEPLSSVLTDFWGGYLSLSLAVVVLGSVYAVKVLRKEFLAFALLAFYVAEVAWIALGFGNPSARYLYVTVPGLTVLAGMAVS